MPKKAPPTIGTVVIPRPEEIWGVYLGQETRPIRSAVWPQHDFEADPGACHPELWAEHHRPFQCEKHVNVHEPVDGSVTGQDWLDWQLSDVSLECSACKALRQDFRLSFIADAVEELERCEQDWRSFFQRYVRIRSVAEGGEVTPHIWQRQAEIIDVLLEGLLPSRPQESQIHDHVIWKSRQIGGSEVIVGFTAFMHVLFRPMAMVRCFSRDRTEAMRWLSAVQDYMWAGLPDWLRPPRNPQSRGRATRPSSTWPGMSASAWPGNAPRSRATAAWAAAARPHS